MLNRLPHFWINRQCDTHRRILAERYLAQHGIAHARVDAVTPETLPTISVRQPFTNSLPELAIFSSHLAAVGAMFHADCELGVIMEDDVRSLHVFDSAALIASAPADWEILQLHVSNLPVVLELGEMYFRHGMLWHEWEPSCFSAGAYLINRRGAARLLSRYRPGGADIDLTGVHAYGKLVADHLLYRRSVCYTATIPYFFNDISLQSTHAPHRDEAHHRPGATGVESVMRRIEQSARGGYPFALRSLAGSGQEPERAQA
ncbi:hypothetical protein [Noviherbaspirillum sp.]|uniref:hypothetical protein n=1 Tax=Noviherbaspirillum sp. TaxID=1926288 RepID=UPI002D609712|nr:hypothetical protein [Noviherbaspirillum sp.]HZW20896.1 hypothetical protein [Noviherbaspirillum sp.]